jgi:hypothetical protein
MSTPTLISIPLDDLGDFDHAVRDMIGEWCKQQKVNPKGSELLAGRIGDLFRFKFSDYRFKVEEET